jgi:hypothetical protein
MNDDTQKPNAASTLRDAIATLERTSQSFHQGATDHSGVFWSDLSCGNLANALDLVLDTHSLLTIFCRDFAMEESVWVKEIDACESKVVAMANRLEQMRRVVELGILRKE